MKKAIIAAVGAAFAASLSMFPAAANAQTLDITGQSHSALAASVTGQEVQKDFWSDLVDDITGNKPSEPANHRPGPPPPPGMHRPGPPPPPGMHRPGPPPPPGMHRPAAPPPPGMHRPGGPGGPGHGPGPGPRRPGPGPRW